MTVDFSYPEGENDEKALFYLQSAFRQEYHAQ